MHKIITLLVTASLLSSPAAAAPVSSRINTASAQSANPSADQTSALPSLQLKWKAVINGSGIYEEEQSVRNGMIFYTADNVLYARNIATGQIRWSYNNGGSPQILTNNSVIFIDQHQQLVKVSIATGKLQWKVKVAKRPIEIGGQASMINGKIVFANESGGVAAFHPVTGAKIWENNSIPMYVGSFYGEYKGVLVVSSTIDNIRRQFFGLDPVTGARLWRTEGIFTYLGLEEGQLVLREESKAPSSNSATPVPGHLLTLVHLDPATGKVSNRQNYNPLEDVTRMGHYHTVIQGSSIYSADGNLDQDEMVLTRFTKGESAEAASKSYKDSGSWVAGPMEGMAFFQKGTQLLGVNLADDSVTRFGHPASKIISLVRVGKAVFASYKNGDFSISNAETGELLGVTKTGDKHPYFYNIFVVNGTVLVPTESRLLALTLPKELQ